MNKFSFIKIIEIPVVGDLKMQQDQVILEKARSSVAYVFKNKGSASSFSKDIDKYVDDVEIVDDKRKNTYKVRVKLKQDDSGKNKDTMKIVNSAQKNNGKIDVREQKMLEYISNNVFPRRKVRTIHDWDKDSKKALRKADLTRWEDEIDPPKVNPDDEDWEGDEGAEDFENWKINDPENNDEYKRFDNDKELKSTEPTDNDNKDDEKEREEKDKEDKSDEEKENKAEKERGWRRR